MDPAEQFHPRKIIRVDDQDLVFEKLPENIVTKILSSLSTKDAVKISILSKRWKSGLFSVTNLDFDDRFIDESYGRLSKEDFCNFVDNVLTHNDKSITLGNFTLELREHYGPCIPTWISAAIESNVKRMDIFTYYRTDDKKIPLPSSFFGQRCLRELRLTLPTEIHVSSLRLFTNLKILHLGLVTIVNDTDDDNHQLSNEEVIREALVTFSNIEILGFSKCTFTDFTQVIIDAPMLTEFRMEFCLLKMMGEDSYECVFRLTSSPNLKKFLCLAWLHAEKIVLFKPSPVIEARLTLIRHIEVDISYIMGMISQLDKVKTLHLSTEVLMFIDREEQMEAIPKLERMTLLKLTVYDNFSLDTLLRFVQKTPSLRTIKLKMISGDRVVVEEDKEAAQVSLRQILQHLPEVKFVYRSRNK